MKKIMILGGNPETASLVQTASAMGFHTIVVDMNHGSPAKNYASESYDIDVFDVSKVSKLARKRKVDAVLVGVADVLVKPYWEICRTLNLPCYANKKAIEAFGSKDGFKKYCKKNGVQDIPGIYWDNSSPAEKPIEIDYPLMIKPVDSGGGVGMTICRKDSDYTNAIKNAMKFSKKGVVLIEKYMECDDMAAYFTFRDGVPYISAISDRITTKKQGDASPVCIGAIFPSKYSDLFVEKAFPKLCELFKEIEIENGILNIQFFVEDGIFYAYDPGFRLQGEAPHIPIAHINGFDHRRMLIDFAFTGKFGEDDFPEKNDFRFKDKKACTIWVLLNEGKIRSIQGLDVIKNDEEVIFTLERFRVGDTVKEEWLGTEKQVFARIYLVSDTIFEINEKIRTFEKLLKIHDFKGRDMVLDWLRPFNLEDYSENKV